MQYKFAKEWQENVVTSQAHHSKQLPHVTFRIPGPYIYTKVLPLVQLMWDLRCDNHFTFKAQCARWLMGQAQSTPLISTSKQPPYTTCNAHDCG